MYLSRLYIENYRSIKKLDVHFSRGKNVIIGRNNTGKSNIVKALDLILGQSSPTYAKSDALNDNDFHSWKEPSQDGYNTRVADDIFIWCELLRERGEQINYEELYRCYGFYIYCDVVEWIANRPIKQPIRISRDRIPEHYGEVFEIDEDEIDRNLKEYINPKLRNQRTFEQQFENKYSFSFAFRAVKTQDGMISKDIRFLYRESQDSDWIMAFKAPIRNELLQSAIIPSFRDPQNQLRLNTWTWYGKLMQHLTSDQAKSDELRNAFGHVKKVGDKIFEHAKQEITNSALDVAFPGTEIHFQFNADTTIDLYKSCLIYIDDGFKSQLTEKGSGIQSATIIGLFNYFTQNVNRITSALLCVEEPELYLHPHARRVISDRLDDFLDGNRNQVILTTHSVEFIRANSDDLNLILIHKSEAEGTIGLGVNAREFKHLLIDNNQNEVFFADKVIVCEGYDDYILKALSKELFPKHLDEQNVSIISVGGKDNLSKVVKLVIRLGIKCFVMTDFDYLLRDKSDERLKFGDVKAHESILSLGEHFFSQQCILGARGATGWAYLQRLRTKIKRENEEGFYTAKTAGEVDDIRVTRVLPKLRKNGVCLLSGQIEDLCRDEEFVSSSRKLSLNRVFELHGRLSAGERVSDIFDAGEIREFLEVVFSR